MTIVISGTVGVGKSVISKLLFEKFKESKENVFLHHELEGDTNPYLDYYYKNRPNWSFLIQLDFLFERFKSVMADKSEQKKYQDHISIFDRHFFDDFVIANLKSVMEDMTRMQWNQYFLINNHLSKKIRENDKPDYFFLLKADFDIILKRIKERGRESEYNVDKKYWKDMYYQYYENPKIQKYFKEHVVKFIVINTNSNNLDLIVEEIINKMK